MISRGSWALLLVGNGTGEEPEPDLRGRDRLAVNFTSNQEIYDRTTFFLEMDCL